jgi:competence ComEA-like helix-hairpin-helix protein
MADESAGSPAPKPLLRRTDQLVIAALAASALVAIGGYWISQAALRHRLIDIDRTARPSAAFRVDINLADYTEFMELPGAGQTLARRIVAWRSAHGRFTSIDQLRQVSGIGPKRLESWRPYLRPIIRLADQANLPATGERGQ